MRVLQVINNGAIHYMRRLGSAKHMRSINGDCFSIIGPQEGEIGASCLFDVNYSLPEREAIKAVIGEVLAHEEIGYYVFWGFDIPESYQSAARELGVEKVLANESIPMALFRDEYNDNEDAGPLTIRKVATATEFRQWAEFNNQHLFNGTQILHPEHYFFLCAEGELECYLGFLENELVTASSIMRNIGMWSLEFVSTHSEYRKKGYARALNTRVIRDCFDSTDTTMITLRSTPAGKRLYLSLGFREY